MITEGRRGRRRPNLAAAGFGNLAIIMEILNKG
jgi:hypothetical protein